MREYVPDNWVIIKIEGDGGRKYIRSSGGARVFVVKDGKLMETTDVFC